MQRLNAGTGSSTGKDVGSVGDSGSVETNAHLLRADEVLAALGVDQERGLSDAQVGWFMKQIYFCPQLRGNSSWKSHTFGISSSSTSVECFETFCLKAWRVHGCNGLTSIVKYVSSALAKICKVCLLYMLFLERESVGGQVWIGFDSSWN